MGAIRDLDKYFWTRARPQPNGCWLWQGKPTKRTSERDPGYGRITINGVSHYAHRVAWELAHKMPVPEGTYICHDCPAGDNPLCVNPAHLYAGTALTNKQDSVRKGTYAHGETHGLVKDPSRAVRGEKHPAHTHADYFLRGEANPNAKLTQDMVDRIFSMANGGMSAREIAPAFGVSYGLIARVLAGRNIGWHPTSGGRDPGVAKATRLRRAHGAAHGSAKLTQELVDRIFALRLQGLSQQAITAQVGVNQSHVSKVLLFQTTWRPSDPNQQPLAAKDHFKT